MTIKQKFERIDQSKLEPNQVNALKIVVDFTENFKTKDKEKIKITNDKLDTIIGKLQEKNPDALKPIPTAKKSVGAKKTTSAKTPRRNVFSVAKEIKKAGETFEQAKVRASKIMKQEKEEANKIVKTEMQKLQEYIKEHKELQGISGTDLGRDAVRVAKVGGRRISKNGNIYYENRENRKDRLAPNYPKYAPLLEKGGEFMTDPNFGNFQNQVYAQGGVVRTFDDVFGETKIFKEEKVGKFTIGISSGFRDNRHVYIYEGGLGDYKGKSLPKNFRQSPQLSISEANDYYSHLKKKNEKMAMGGFMDNVYADGGDLSDVELNFTFDTEGDAEYEYQQEVEKIKILRQRISFDEVRGSVDYGKTKDNTDLKFYKKGKLVMTLKGDYDTDSEILDTDVKILGAKHKINYHPYDGMGGVDYYALKSQLEKTVFADGGRVYNGEVDYKKASKLLIEHKPEILYYSDGYVFIDGVGLNLGSLTNKFKGYGDSTDIKNLIYKVTHAPFDEAKKNIEKFTKGEYTLTKGGYGNETHFLKPTKKMAEGGEFMTDPNFGNFQNQVYAKGGLVASKMEIEYDGDNVYFKQKVGTETFYNHVWKTHKGLYGSSGYEGGHKYFDNKADAIKYCKDILEKEVQEYIDLRPNNIKDYIGKTYRSIDKNKEFLHYIGGFRKQNSKNSKNFEWSERNKKMVKIDGQYKPEFIVLKMELTPRLNPYDEKQTSKETTLDFVTLDEIKKTTKDFNLKNIKLPSKLQQKVDSHKIYFERFEGKKLEDGGDLKGYVEITNPQTELFDKGYRIYGGDAWETFEDVKKAFPDGLPKDAFVVKLVSGKYPSFQIAEKAKFADGGVFAPNVSDGTQFMGSVYAKGGDLKGFSDNQLMIMNQNVQIEHHHEELEDVLENKTEVPAWVVAKMATATQSISDVTHYLDGEKELLEEEEEELMEQEDEDEVIVSEITLPSAKKTELTKKFTEDALVNLKGFLKGKEGVELQDDYTFTYKGEKFEIEPIIDSDDDGVLNALFTVYNKDDEEVGEITYMRGSGKQKFNAKSNFFKWSNTKFADGGAFAPNVSDGTQFMGGVYANGGGLKSEFVDLNEPPVGYNLFTYFYSTDEKSGKIVWNIVGAYNDVENGKKVRKWLDRQAEQSGFVTLKDGTEIKISGRGSATQSGLARDVELNKGIIRVWEEFKPKYWNNETSDDYAHGGSTEKYKVGQKFYDTRYDRVCEIVPSSYDGLVTWKRYNKSGTEFENDTKHSLVENQFDYLVNMGAYQISKQSMAKGGLLTPRERYILEIKGLSGVRETAIEDYIKENDLSNDDVLNIVIGLGRRQLKGTDVSTAIVGKKGNSASKKLISFAKGNEALKMADGGEFMTDPNFGNFQNQVYARGGGVGKMYYHILEYGDYGNIGYQGYYDTMEEAQKQVEKLSNYFPNQTFQIFADKSKKEPPITTMARGGYVSKGELVWRNLSNLDRSNFLYENFTPEITPMSQELLIRKDFNFLPKKVKIKMEAKYANVEDYAKGGIIVTKIKDIPNLKDKVEKGQVTYRGLGAGKLADDFYKLAGQNGTRIKVDGQEYFITDDDFKELDWDFKNEKWMNKVKFNASARKYDIGGVVVADLAGHTGGSFGTTTPTLLTGYSGTHYGGLTGETGAMSVGEMFEAGGTLGDPTFLNAYSGTRYTGLVAETGALSSGELFADGGDIEKSNITVAKRLKVKKWYLKSYPTDDLGEEIKENVTFWSLWSMMSQGYDVYDILGVSDSLLRERVFQKLSEILGVDYNYVYQKWLNSDTYEMGGGLPNGVQQSYVNYYLGSTGILAEGGSLEAHGIEEGDTFIKTIAGNIQKVKDKDGKIVFINLSTGERDSQPPLPFKKGGNVDGKWVNNSQDYEVRYAKGKNRHGYGHIKYLGGGVVDGDLNKKVYDLASKSRFLISDWATSEYNLILAQALVESLTDANFHSEAKEVVAKLEKKPWSDEMYESVYYDPDKDVVEFSSTVARICDYDGDDIVNAYYYLAKMQGSSVGNLIDDLFLSKSKTTNYKIKPSTVSFSIFEKIINESKSEEDAFNKAREVKGIPLEVSKSFMEKYDPNRELTPRQSFSKFYKEVKANASKPIAKSSSKSKKYIDHDDIVLINIKKGSKQLTYKAVDVLNGANILEKGGQLEKIANYIPIRDVISVDLKDGTQVKPSNGYWIKKDAKPYIVGKLGTFDEGGNLDKVKWQDVEKGDSARVKDDNKMGLVVKNYGRKFHLKFPNGTEKTFDASDLEFFKLEKDEYEMDDYNYKEGGKIEDFKIGDFVKRTKKEGNITHGTQGFIYEIDKLFSEIYLEDEYGNKISKPYKIEGFRKLKSKSRYDEGGKVEEATINKDGIRVRSVSQPKKKLTEAEWLAKHSESKEARSYKSGGDLSKYSEFIQDEFPESKKLANKFAKKYNLPFLVLVEKDNDDEIYIKEANGFYAFPKSYIDAHDVLYVTADKMAEGGATFDEKSTSIAKKFVGKAVEPKYQKEYGKVYSKKEADEVGDKIAGSMVAKEKMKKGGITNRGGIMLLAKQIRKENESWKDALKRAGEQLRK